MIDVTMSGWIKHLDWDSPTEAYHECRRADGGSWESWSWSPQTRPPWTWCSWNTCLFCVAGEKSKEGVLAGHCSWGDHVYGRFASDQITFRRLRLHIFDWILPKQLEFTRATACKFIWTATRRHIELELWVSGWNLLQRIFWYIL